MGMNTVIHGKDSTGSPEVLGTTSGNLHVFSSATTAAAVTPHDTNANAYQALWIGSTTGGTGSDGYLTVITSGGSTVEFQGIPTGTLLPVATSVIKDTGTGVSLIVGLNW